MTIKELKELLSSYDDEQEIKVMIRGKYKMFPIVGMGQINVHSRDDYIAFISYKEDH